MSQGQYDIVVIGAGIHGSAIAYDATLRGFSTVLLDKKDIGSGASQGNYRIIHGGLRYLQHLDFVRLFESADEQQIFRQIVPDALVPLPFLIPCYAYGMRGREIVEVGLTLYDALTSYRNNNVKPELKLPWHRSISKEEVLEKLPYLERKQLRGGVIYYDVQMLDPDRLTLSFALSAKKLGCDIKTYSEIVGSEFANGKIEKLKIRNTLTKVEQTLSAKLVINAAGAWREQITSKLLNTNTVDQFIFSKGLQLTLPPLTSSLAVALESKFRDSESVVAKGNRSYFLQPWRGCTIAGTADILHTAEPDKYYLSEEEINFFLDELKDIYPDPQISRANVKSVFGGLRPVTPSVRLRHKQNQVPKYGSIEVAHRDTLIDHRLDTSRVKNLISVEGIKYTTTRRLAETVVNLAESILGEKRKACLTRVKPLIYSPIPATLSDEEIKRIVTEEMVVTIDDLLERRLGFGGLEKPSEKELKRIERVFLDSRN